MQTVKDIGNDVCTVTLSDGSLHDIPCGIDVVTMTPGPHYVVTPGLDEVIIMEGQTFTHTVTLIPNVTCPPFDKEYFNKGTLWLMLIVFVCWLFPRRR